MKPISSFGIVSLLLICFLVGGTRNVCAQLEVNYTIGDGPLIELDSLEKKLQQVPDSERLPILLKLTDGYKAYSRRRSGLRDTAIAYGREARWRAEQIADTLMLSAVLGDLASLFRWDSLLRDSVDILFRQKADLQKRYGYLIPADYAKRNETFRENLRNYLSVLSDSAGSLTLDSLRRIPFGVDLEVNPGSLGQPGNTEDRWWVRFRIRNGEQKWREHHFYVKGWDSVEVYIVRPYGEIERSLTGETVEGDEMAVREEPGYFACNVPAEGTLTVYVNLKGFAYSTPPSEIKVYHVNYEAYLQQRVKDRHINGIFQGVVLVQLFFFFLLFLITRDKIYGYFVVYVLGLGIFILNVNYSGEIPGLEGGGELYIYLLAIWLTTVGMLTFSAAYLDLSKNLPSWKNTLKVFLAIFTVFSLITAGLITLAAPTLRSSNPEIAILMVLGLDVMVLFGMVVVALIFLLIWGIKALRIGYAPAKYYMLATGFLILGVATPIALTPFAEWLLEMGFFQNVDLGTIVEGGIALQLCLSALGVGQQRNRLEKERRDALQTNLEMQQKINTATDRFVPYEFLRTLGRESILDVNLGDQVEKFVTVFFSDIREYTRLSEQMTPQQNFIFLNHYLGRVGPVIKTNRGFVNQYYGDGIMALFMGENTGVKSSFDAVKAAVEMHKELKVYNQEREQKHREAIQMGIGIHSGSLMLGVIGDEKRMDVGVVSDAVNTAARMEGLTKHYGASVVISESTFNGIETPEDFLYRYLGMVQVKGRKAPTQVYDFFDGDPDYVLDRKAETLTLFKEGLDAYFAKRFEQAGKIFREILNRFPEDKASAFYLGRTEVYQREGVAEDWTGVEMMDKK